MPNRGEGRHAVRGLSATDNVARGQEGQLGAPGLVTNAIVLWNTLCIQEALSWMHNNGEETVD